MSKSQDAKPGSQQQVVKCVFHATISTGIFSGDSFICGATAVGDYYDPLYKCRRAVCRRHANVVNRNAVKFQREEVRYFKALNDKLRRCG